MRTQAVAADGFHLDGGWLDFLKAIGGAAFGALGLWLAQKGMGKAAFEQVLHDWSRALLEKQERQHDADQQAIQDLSQRLTLEQAKSMKLEGAITNLEMTIERLHRILREHGVEGLEREVRGRDRTGITEL